jgi:hypothetical protein
MSLAWGQPVPSAVVMWELAEATGWTLEYIDGLSLSRLHEWLSIRDGKHKAAESWRTRHARKNR